MSIGTTIKRLRHNKNITQEQLAERLGVSTNAVSQWERDKTAPDISHLPMLANIFEVSADILLEIDLSKSKKKAEIENFTVKYQELHSQGKTAERLALCREMQKKYPNDETVCYYLMRVLQSGYAKESLDEIVLLGEQLMTSATMEYRTKAIRELFFTFLRVGDKEKALQYADMIPPSDDLRLHALEGAALVEHCQNYFYGVCDQMYLYMNYLANADESGYTHEEKHALWETLYDTFYKVFPQKDFGFYHDRLARISFFMALESAKAGQMARALDELEELLEHVELFQSFSEIAHSSLLVNKLRRNIANTTKSSAEPFWRSYLRYLNQSESVFVDLKDDCRYTAIKEKLGALL